MAWAKAGSETLGTAGDVITSGTITASKFNQILSSDLASGALSTQVVFNSDTGSNYAYRNSWDGTSDGTGVNNANVQQWDGNNGSSTPQFVVSYVCNIDGEEKLGMYNAVDQSTTGAGTAPHRREVVYKYTGTSQITKIDINNSGAGSFDTSSNLSVLGSDLTPAAAIPFPTNVQVGSRAEITDTRKMYNLKGPDTVTFEDDFTSYANDAAIDVVYPAADTTIGGNATTNVIDYVTYANNTNDSLSRDLTSVDDEKWILRFKFNHTTSSHNGSGYEMFPCIGLSSADYNTNSSANQDGIVLCPYQDNLDRPYYINYADGTNIHGDMGAGGPRATAFTETVTNGDEFWVEITRTSATTVVCKLFSELTYTTLVEEKSLTVPATCTGLRYFVIKNAKPEQNQSGSQTGTVTDIKFYNGISSISTSSTWQEIGT